MSYLIRLERAVPFVWIRVLSIDVFLREKGIIHFRQLEFLWFVLQTNTIWRVVDNPAITLL